MICQHNDQAEEKFSRGGPAARRFGLLRIARTGGLA
jgi:hypothetical protein